jgi:aconitase A
LADLKPHAEVTVHARKVDGKEVVFKMLARIDPAVDLRCWQGGGIYRPC